MARWRWVDLPELVLESFDPSVRPPQRVRGEARRGTPPEPPKRINFLLQLLLAALFTYGFLQLATLAWDPSIDHLAALQAGALLLVFLFFAVGMVTTVVLTFL